MAHNFSIRPPLIEKSVLMLNEQTGHAIKLRSKYKGEDKSGDRIKDYS